MKTLQECCDEYKNSQELSHECVAALVAYAYCSPEPVIMGLAQMGVRRAFLAMEGPRILLPCHKGRGLDVTKAFLLHSHATKYGVKVYFCGEGCAELLR